MAAARCIDAGCCRPDAVVEDGWRGLGRRGLVHDGGVEQVREEVGRGR